jgi:hypothetical protein
LPEALLEGEHILVDTTNDDNDDNDFETLEGVDLSSSAREKHPANGGESQPRTVISDDSLKECASKKLMTSIYGSRGVIEQLRNAATSRSAHTSLPLQIAALVLPKQHKDIVAYSRHIMSTQVEHLLPTFINATPGIYDDDNVDVFGIPISMRKLVEEQRLMRSCCSSLVGRIDEIDFLSMDEGKGHISSLEQAGHTQKMFENAVRSNTKLAECTRFFNVSTALMTKAKAELDGTSVESFRMELKGHLFAMLSRIRPVKVPTGCESLYSCGHEETVSSVLISQLRLHLRLMDWILWCLEYISGPVGESEGGPGNIGFLNDSDKHPFFNVETFGRVIMRQLMYLTIQLPQRFKLHGYARNTEKIDLEVLSLWMRIWYWHPLCL